MDKSSRLKIIRILNGFTQDGLAKLIDLPRSALSIWESGKKYGPAEESVPKLADALNVTPGYLMFGYPEITNAVWIPQPPSRPHHLKSLENDIRLLFPAFLNENNLNAVIPGELGDGGYAFLLGRDVTSSGNKHDLLSYESTLQRKQELFFSCLLLADKRVVASFRTAFKAAEMEIFGEQMLLDSTVDTFNAEILDRMASRGRYFSIDIKSLSHELIAVRGRQEKGPPSPWPSTKYIFLAFMEATKNFEIEGEALTVISDLFALKNNELGPLPNNEIATLPLLKEITEKLESIGCKKTVRPPKLVPESEDETYLLIREWLHEFWLSAGDDEKSSFIELIKKETDYRKWFAKYVQDVDEGSRPPARWF